MKPAKFLLLVSVIAAVCGGIAGWVSARAVTGWQGEAATRQLAEQMVEHMDTLKTRAGQIEVRIQDGRAELETFKRGVVLGNLLAQCNSDAMRRLGIVSVTMNEGDPCCSTYRLDVKDGLWGDAFQRDNAMRSAVAPWKLIDAAFYLRAVDAATGKVLGEYGRVKAP